MFYRSNKRKPSEYFKGYCNDYLVPDQALTIGQIIERHLDSSQVSNHQNEVMEDVNIESPFRYDSDLTDVKTKYQDKDYFEEMEYRRNHIGDGSFDYNPKNLNSYEKVSPSSSQSVPSDSPVS